MSRLRSSAFSLLSHNFSWRTTAKILSIAFLCLWQVPAAVTNKDRIASKVAYRDVEREPIAVIDELLDPVGQADIGQRLKDGERALALSIEIGSDDYRVRSLLHLGNLYRELGDSGRALEYFERALETCRELGDEEKVAESMGKIGLVYKNLNRHEKALDFLSRVLAIYRQSGDLQKEAATLNNIALVYKRIDAYDKALESLSQAQRIKERLGDKRGLATGLNNIGLIYRHLGSNRLALEYLLKSLKLKEELNNRKGAAVSLNNIGLIYLELLDYDKALEYLLRSLTIKEEIGYQKGIASTLNNIGHIYMELEDFEKSLEYYQRALLINRESGNKTGEAHSLNNMGLLYDRIDEQGRALACVKRARDISRKIQDNSGIANAYINLGLIYRTMGNYKAAQDSCRQALTVGRQKGDKKEICLALKDMGINYLHMGRFDQGGQSLRRALYVAEGIGDKKEIAAILLNLSDVHVKTQKIFQALEYLEKSRDIAADINAKNILKDCYDSFSKIYYDKGDYRQAYRYAKLFEDVKDNILTRESSNKIAQLRARMEAENEKREKEIEILKRDNAIMDLELKRETMAQKAYVTTIVIFFLLLLLSGYLYVSKSRAGRETAKAFQKTLHEIGERKRVESEKHYLQEQLFQMQKMESIGRLAGGIAHEFNNLLTGLMGYAEILRMKFHDNKEIEGRAAEIIYKSSVMAQELTRRLLGFARRGKYNPVSLDLNGVIKEAVGVSGIVFEKNITLEYRFTENLDAVKADKNQLAQALTNLMINAKDAMPKGGQIIFESVVMDIAGPGTGPHPHIIAPGRYVKLCVTDTGVGMTKEVKDKIFEPFFTTKESGKGVGLGLSTVYGIIKNHNGYIFCDSQLGQGTTFSIYLPAENEPLEIEVPLEAKQEPIEPGSGTILVVDDERVVLNLSRDLLEPLGYQLILVDEGKRALEIYRRSGHTIDMVMLDLIMPEMDGGQVFYELKEMDPEVRVLIFSGFSKNEKVRQLLKDGARGFVEKPFNAADLARAVSEVIGRN